MSQTTPPSSYEDLRRIISTRHDGLSKRLSQIAAFALANPNDMALETVSEIAARAAVQPSSLIRFAKTFGFDGFSSMQRVFRERLTERQPSYRERIKALKEQSDAPLTAITVLDRFTEAASHALHHLREETKPELLERAIEHLAESRQTYIMGQRRAFPVAAYLNYMLSHLGCRVSLIDSVGGMAFEQARSLSSNDLLLAISFQSYAPDTLAITTQAREQGSKVIAITDGPLSPLAALSDVCFEVEEAQVESFRSLSACMCLSLSLVVCLGYRLEKTTDFDRLFA
ncbi:MurR/RpiR family transcriptional regulator [Denitrobaculum tricleocarpae]|uniref:MurR/RpiR family transcriptional regulator n=1 Tax=Denitrobaculum tricleocarpae TaxID=2591009 RepID=A0A545T3Z9_9PROT|nr:MurR/RpiR family transcriptional regulator [Denitrobaculum tricleocarpae]TQV71949.1 MurR/RpiR family transcriptional regulator [Denitrobaculum tricleocarpae]